jgi:hypothetical protein
MLAQVVEQEAVVGDGKALREQYGVHLHVLV